MAISTAPPTPLRNYRPDLPVELENLLLRCLEKDRGKRVATVAELATELVKFAPRRSRLSAERIERLARAAGFSASALVFASVVRQRNSSGTARVVDDRRIRAHQAGHIHEQAARDARDRGGAHGAGALGVFALRRPTRMRGLAEVSRCRLRSRPCRLKMAAEGTTPPPQLAPTATAQAAAWVVVPPAAS